MSEYENKVLVITSLGPVEFPSVERALNSSATDHDDPAFDGLSTFQRTMRAGHIRQLVERWNLSWQPDDDPDNDGTKARVWRQLADMAIDEQEALKRRQPQKQPKPQAPKSEAPRKKPGPKPATRTGAKVKWQPGARIYVKAKENPKRQDAARRFELYHDGMTVQEYLDAGGKRSDVNWDERNDWIQVINPEDQKGEQDG